MTERFQLETSGPGPDLAYCATDKFKTLTVRVLFRRPLGTDLAWNAALARVLARGTRKTPELWAFQARLKELYGAELRSDNGRIDQQATLVLELSLPAERYLPSRGVEEAALDLLHDVLLDPDASRGSFRPDVVAEEVRHLQQELATILNDKAEYAHLKLLEAMYPNDPYAWPKTGRREDLETLNGENLYLHYQTLLAEAPSVIYVVGPGADRVAERLRERLQALSGGFLQPLQGPKPASGRGLFLEERQPVTQGKLAIGYRCRDNLFTELGPALRVMTGILGGYSHSKLFQNVREKASLAYYAYARLDGFKGALYIHSGIDPENYQATLEIIRRQVEDMAEGRFGEEEWRNTLEAMEYSLAVAKDHPSRMIEQHLERVLSARPTQPDEEIERLRAVSREEIMAAAKGLTLDAVFFLRGEGVR